MKLEKFLFLLFFTTAIVVFSSGVSAASSSSISVNMAPENPNPYENVNITLSSYASNLDSVLITWSVDGKIVISKIGQKSFSLNAPAANAEVMVLATIFLPDGEIEKRLIIRPAVMTLLFQATDSYVPPFYRGKALPTADSEIKIVAMPEIRSSSGFYNSKNMTYSWKKDYTNMQEESGYGKNFFIYVNDYLDDSSNISVVASTVDQRYSSGANITVGTSEPKIVFYKNDNELGTIWERELPSRHTIQNDEIILAAPYFVSPKDLRNPRLVWSWFINDTQIALQNLQKNLMPLKAQEGISGTSKVKLKIENMDRIFQTTSKEINIEF